MPTPSFLPPLLVSTALCAFLALALAMSHWLGISMPEWGVYPRELSGLKGILLAPLLHGSWSHLINNSAPLVFLGTGLWLGYPRSRLWAIAIIWLGSGLGTWIFARSSFHFGASGLTHGLFFYLLIIGLIRRDKRSTALLMMAFFLYGGMLMTIFPREPGISYEMHFFGALMGVIAAVAFRHTDPMPKQKKYSWETEDDSYLDENPYWLENGNDAENPDEGDSSPVNKSGLGGSRDYH